MTQTATQKATVTGIDVLVDGFERNRPRLRAVAYRMLGSLAEADDAVQEAWLRASRSGVDGVDNLAAWLTTIVARICLNVLRARKTHPEDPMGVHVPDPLISSADRPTPEDEALLADSVGLALHVVLDTLAPAERLAFVLHDMFDVPFNQIAPMLDRSPAMARQLASRARRRVRDVAVPAPGSDIARQREVVDAFFAAAHHGDFDALVAVLDPGVVLRADGGIARAETTVEVHGAAAVARHTLTTARLSNLKLPVLVNGAAGVIVTAGDQPIAVMGFTIAHGKITHINAITDSDRLRRLDLTVTND